MSDSSVRSSLYASGLAVALAVLALGGCGQTRYVVVENQAVAAPTPVAAEAPVVASADQEAAIRSALDGAIGLDDRGFADRLDYLHEADDLESTYGVVIDLVNGVDVEVQVGNITVDSSGDRAEVEVTVEADGAELAAGVPVELISLEGTWKVTRDGACAVLSIGSPCPNL